jgi:hypothetical protein
MVILLGVVVGFALRFNPLLVVTVTGITSALTTPAVLLTFLAASGHWRDSLPLRASVPPLATITKYGCSEFFLEKFVGPDQTEPGKKRIMRHPLCDGRVTGGKRS